MSKYYTAETDAQGSVNNESHWVATGAKTLTAAKRIASQRQSFQGTAIHVGEKRDEKIVAIAVKRDDALDMHVRGAWIDYE
jgi:hypothetical protein